MFLGADDEVWVARGPGRRPVGAIAGVAGGPYGARVERAVDVRAASGHPSAPGHGDVMPVSVGYDAGADDRLVPPTEVPTPKARRPAPSDTP